MWSFLTPGWATVCAKKKSYHKYERTSNCPYGFSFKKAGARQVFHLHLVPNQNDICVQLAWVQPHFSINVERIILLLQAMTNFFKCLILDL